MSVIPASLQSRPWLLLVVGGLLALFVLPRVLRLL